MNARIQRGLACIIVAALTGVAGCAASDGSEAPTAQAGKPAPGKRVPGKRAPGKRAPGKRVPGKHAAKPAPGKRAPGKRVPGKKMPAPEKCAAAERTDEMAAACFDADALDTETLDVTEAPLDAEEDTCLDEADEDCDTGEP